MIEAQTEKEKFLMIKFPIGKTFLSVGNDFEVNPLAKTYFKIKVCGYDRITQSKKLIPIFEDENGKKIISMAIKIEYSKEVEDTLKKLTAR